MASHELGDLSREPGNYWLARCSCGWESDEYRQRHYATKEFAEHVAQENEPVYRNLKLIRPPYDFAKDGM